MIAASPHQYRQDGLRRGVAPQTIERALRQAAPPESQQLPAILTLRHLGHLTGADYTYLRAVVSRDRDFYRRFTIRKRSGGGRLIAVPEPTLAAVQAWIHREILCRRAPHHASMAYAPGSSPIRCAVRHLGAKWLIKVDIHDFFESISERSVYFVFRTCGYQPLVAFELARLCTRQSRSRWARARGWDTPRKGTGHIGAYASWTMGHLPQGAPTSPMLSNLAVFAMDNKLQALADRYGLIYTRYSDDLIFSAGDLDRRRAAAVLINVRRIFSGFGFRLHRKKVTVAPPGARKVVLGLLVDGDRLRLSSEMRRRLRDHIRGAEKFGLVAHVEHRHFGSVWGFVRHVEGLLAYAQSVDAAFAVPLAQRFRAALAGEGWSP